MGSERRDRFLKLERPRPEGDGVPDSSTDRFREPPERPPEPVRTGGVAQPYVRCAACEMDNTVYAQACQNCGAALDTPEQRSFNERHWAERQAAEAARKERNAREEAQQREAAELARQRREIAEQMARREKERVDAQFPDG